MTIGIIGTGNIGGTLARKLSAAGNDIRVANSRGPEGVRAFANEIGATAVGTRGAVKDVDVIVISIPFPAVAQPKNCSARSAGCSGHRQRSRFSIDAREFATSDDWFPEPTAALLSAYFTADTDRRALRSAGIRSHLKSN